MFFASIFFFVCAWIVIGDKSACDSRYLGRGLDLVDIYWINLDHSVSRKRFMTDQFDFYHLNHSTRIRALTPKDVYIPSDLSRPEQCTKSGEDSIDAASVAMKSASDLQKSPFRVLITEHCGRKKNTKRELTVTSSHLKAIRTAIYANNSKPYALILEDDLQLAFDIDFQALINSAPQDFAMLQLITSNEYELVLLWKMYWKQKKLWNLRGVEQDYWCAGAYLFNKTALKPIIDGIVEDKGDGLYHYKVIAGYTRPCFPKRCCGPQGSFLGTSPCVHAARGYQSDHFLFMMAPQRTYMITVPVVTGAKVGNRSTLHQQHVGLHVGAFHRINSYVTEMKLGEAPVPPFVAVNCSYEGYNNRSAGTAAAAAAAAAAATAAAVATGVSGGAAVGMIMSIAVAGAANASSGFIGSTSRLVAGGTSSGGGGSGAVGGGGKGRHSNPSGREAGVRGSGGVLPAKGVPVKGVGLGHGLLMLTAGSRSAMRATVEKGGGIKASGAHAVASGAAGDAKTMLKATASGRLGEGGSGRGGTVGEREGERGGADIAGNRKADRRHKDRQDTEDEDDAILHETDD